jgi:hypothetical protein
VPRRSPIERVAAAVLAGLLGLAACSGSSATPAPTPTPDPQAVLTQSLANFQQAASFHVSGTIGGKIDMGAASRLSGTSIGLTGKLDLSGGTIAGDVDARRPAARATVSFPSIFGLEIDLIEVDASAYTRINLMSDTYTKSRLDPTAFASGVPGAVLDPANLGAQLRGLLESPGVTVTPSGTATVDGRRAHRFDVTVAPSLINEQLATLAPGLPSDVAVDSASATYLVYVDSLEPAGLRIVASSASLGSLDVSLTITAYGQPVTIEAPPASEVEE